MIVQERYSPVVLAANTAHTIRASSLGGFLCKTSGTLTVVNKAGVTIINAVAVTAGAYTPLPFSLGEGEHTITVTTAGGAEGTLGVV